MKTKISIIGFILFVVGFLSIILKLVGLRLIGMGFLDDISPLLGFLVSMLMIFAGVIMVYVARTTDFDSKESS